VVDFLLQGEHDPYAAAKEMDMFKVIKSPRDMTTSTIIQRILANHEAYKVQMSVSFFLCDMSLVVNGG
jgi:hypothetical protein